MTFECKENCSADCCGVIPFDSEFLDKRKHLFQVKEYQTIKSGNLSELLAPDWKCVFLNRETFKCAIYDERPQVCRDYGTEKGLECPYVNRLGISRSAKGILRAIRRIDEYVDKTIEKIKRRKLK